MAATRTDVHSPTNLTPENYHFRGTVDLNPEADGDPLAALHITQQRQALIRRLLDEGLRFDGIHGHGQCDHCGARIRYAAIMQHIPTGTLIQVGETCLDNRFALTKDEFQRLRTEAKLNRDRVKRSDAARAVLDANPGLEDALTADHPISSDLARKLARYGTLSDKQIALAFRLHEQERERAAVEAEREAERQRLVEAGVEVPEGRVTVEGTVVAVTLRETPYGSTWKAVVESDEGWKVWTTVPAAILDAVQGADEVKGRRVRFVGTVSRSDDDPTFGFVKRPSKAGLV